MKKYSGWSSHHECSLERSEKSWWLRAEWQSWKLENWARTLVQDPSWGELASCYVGSSFPPLLPSSCYELFGIRVSFYHTLPLATYFHFSTWSPIHSPGSESLLRYISNVVPNDFHLVACTVKFNPPIAHRRLIPPDVVKFYWSVAGCCAFVTIDIHFSLHASLKVTDICHVIEFPKSLEQLSKK